MALKLLPIIALLLLIQGFYIFKRAKRAGYNHWLWGIIGLLNIPSSLIAFLLLLAYKKGDGFKRILINSILVGFLSSVICFMMCFAFNKGFTLTPELLGLLLMSFLLSLAAYLLGAIR